MQADKLGERGTGRQTNGQVVINGMQTKGSKSIGIDINHADSSIAVIGSGNFGRALTKELVMSGLSVCNGSRSPSKQISWCPNAVSVEEAIECSKIIIFAVPFDFVNTLPLANIANGKVVIDCSNRTKVCKDGDQSQAEMIQSMVPKGVMVVKALNTLSAYALENNMTGGNNNAHNIPIASDDKEAKKAVSSLIEAMGYRAVDYGGLQFARVIENIPLSFFPDWQLPVLISCLVFCLTYLLQFYRSYLCSDNKNGWYPTLEHDGKNFYLTTNMFFKDLIKAADGHALNLLAACYLPGVLAAYLQLIRGTKYSDFPKWLASWMSMRKQFGLQMLFSASIHGCYYCLVKTMNGNANEYPWTEKLYLMTGILGLAFVAILGATSLPSVSSSLSWREFRALQSLLGWFCLILCSLHCASNGWSSENFWQSKLFKKWDNCYAPSSEQTGLILPVITFALKLPLLLPFVDYRLTKIRNGSVFGPTSGWVGLRLFGVEIKC